MALDVKAIATLSGLKAVAKIAENTPDYFAIVTKGIRAKVWAVEVKGTHRSGHHVRQLADAARQVTGVAIDGAVPPSLAFATVLLAAGGRIRVFGLDPAGGDEWVQVSRPARRELPEWDEPNKRIVVRDASNFASHLIEVDALQLSAYATGGEGREPTVEQRVRGEKYVGRRSTFDAGGVVITMFNGVEEETWHSVASGQFDARLESLAASERRFERETVRTDRSVTSFGEDGTILDLKVRARRG